MNVYDKVLLETRLEFPQFKIEKKSESRFMRFLAFLLFFNKAFMVHFVTTIGNTMWVPAVWELWTPDLQASVLRHERVHLQQQKRYGMLRYSLMYLLWPFPILWAAGRTKLEMEAYEESLRSYAEYYGVAILTSEALREGIIAHFTTGQYGWMCINKKKVEAWYDGFARSMLEESA
jgi:hypothetical protein